MVVNKPTDLIRSHQNFTALTFGETRKTVCIMERPNTVQLQLNTTTHETQARL